MREGASRSRLRVIAGTLVLLSITLITLDIKGVGPVESLKRDIGDGLTGTDSFFSHLTSPIRNAWHGMGEYDNLKEDNAKLRDELERLKSAGTSEQIAGEKLAELAQIEAINAALPYETVVARRTTGNGSNFADDSLYIDRGVSSGLSEGMPVVIGAANIPGDAAMFPAQLVGRVEFVYEHKAMVRLISYPSLNFGVRLIQSGQIAVGHGGGSDATSMSPWIIDVGVDIDSGIEVPNGDIVVTASSSDFPIFPPDLPVGKVARKRRVDAENRQVLEVDPWVDLFKAEYFDVILWTPNSLDAGIAPPTTEPEPTSTTADDGLLDPGESGSVSGSIGVPIGSTGAGPPATGGAGASGT